MKVPEFFHYPTTIGSEKKRDRSVHVKKKGRPANGPTGPSGMSKNTGEKKGEGRLSNRKKKKRGKGREKGPTKKLFATEQERVRGRKGVFRSPRVWRRKKGKRRRSAGFSTVFLGRGAERKEKRGEGRSNGKKSTCQKKKKRRATQNSPLPSLGGKVRKGGGNSPLNLSIRHRERKGKRGGRVYRFFFFEPGRG